MNPARLDEIRTAAMNARGNPIWPWLYELLAYIDELKSVPADLSKVKEIEDRLNKATPGPWRWVPRGTEGYILCDGNFYSIIRCVFPDPDVVVEASDADKALIGNAPTDLRFLLNTLYSFLPILDDTARDRGAVPQDCLPSVQLLARLTQLNEYIAKLKMMICMLTDMLMERHLRVDDPEVEFICQAQQLLKETP